MRKGTGILLWCVGIAAIIGVTVYSEWASRPDQPLSVSYMPAETDKAAETILRTVNTDTTAFSENTTVKTSYVTTVLCRDLNLATAADLQRVEGIGEALAAEITAFRDAHGGFTRRAELLEISGIGEVLAERILAEFEIPNELPPLTTALQTISPQTETEPTEPSEPSKPAETTEIPTTYPVCFDLNIVTKEELLLIPQMTEENADAILSLRAEMGHFSNIRELAFVQKLDEHYILDVLADYLYIADTKGDATDVQNP